MRHRFIADVLSGASPTGVVAAESLGAAVETTKRERARHRAAESSDKSRPNGYRPEIDGLRAVAVLAVLLFHLNGVVPGGYTGVDVFFVISGFLITGLIRKDLEAGTFRLSNFWQRRIRRILPAQAVLMAAVLGFGMLLLLPGDFYDLSKAALAQAVFLSNVYFLRHLDYFAGPAELKPLLHMWSLAVEEQFYLGFPLFLLACKGLRRSTLVTVISLLALSSFALSVWGTKAYTSATFFLLPTRAWELLSGSLLTLAPGPARARRLLCEVGAATGLVAICLACAVFDKGTRFPGAAALLPCGGAALIIYFTSSRRIFIGGLLASRPLVFLGLISYSLYLWHWPVFAFCRYLNNDALNGWICISAIVGSCLAAYLSWKYVEMPFRHLTIRRGAAPVFAAALIVSALIASVPLAGWRTRGLPQRFSRDVVDWALEPAAPNRFLTGAVDHVASGRLPILGDASLAGTAPHFLLWGDSHACAIGELADKLARKHAVTGYAACYPGMLPVIGTSCRGQTLPGEQWNCAVMALVRKAKIRQVILVARWSAYVEGPMFIDDARGDRIAALKTGLERTVDELRRMGARVWIMEQVPEQTMNPMREVALAKFLPWRTAPKGVSLEDHRSRQASAHDALSACGALDVVVRDPADAFFDQGVSQLGGGGRSYYSDRDHLSSFGAQALLSGLLDRCLAEIATNQRGNDDHSDGTP